jgi:hypothetical protein
MTKTYKVALISGVYGGEDYSTFIPSTISEWVELTADEHADLKYANMPGDSRLIYAPTNQMETLKDLIAQGKARRLAQEKATELKRKKKEEKARLAKLSQELREKELFEELKKKFTK